MLFFYIYIYREREREREREFIIMFAIIFIFTIRRKIALKMRKIHRQYMIIFLKKFLQ
jgi:hypothetical protein